MLLSLDTSRQWGKSLYAIQQDHVVRYDFAAKYAKGRILDAACGCGYGSSLLAQKGVVTGVDSYKKAIDWANHHFLSDVEYLHARIEDEPWKGRFETVVSLETIEHLKDPVPALEAFRRACVGSFIASVPNEERYPFLAETFARDDSPHYRHYTPEEFDSLLKAHGFTVKERMSQISKSKPQVRPGTDGRFLIYVCE